MDVGKSFDSFIALWLSKKREVSTLKQMFPPPLGEGEGGQKKKEGIYKTILKLGFIRNIHFCNYRTITEVSLSRI